MEGPKRWKWMILKVDSRGRSIQKYMVSSLFEPFGLFVLYITVHFKIFGPFNLIPKDRPLWQTIFDSKVDPIIKSVNNN